MNLKQLKDAAASVEDYVLEVRHHLHAHPEIGWEETETLKYIDLEMMAISKNMPDNIHLDVWYKKGGLMADVTVDETLPRILFRADVDALTVQEKTGLPFASKVDGKMHACGHDTHAAMLLGAFKAIVEGKVTPTCNIRFVFQRAEENPGSTPGKPISGGYELVREGVLKHVDTVHALHISTMGEKSEPGVFYVCPGQALANSDRLQIKVTCKGGHVAMPHNGSNAVVLANQIIAAVDGYVSRTLDPMENAVVEPTVVLAGNPKGNNVRPASAEIWFGVRTFLSQGEREAYMQGLIDFIIKSVSCYEDASVEATPVWGHPTTFNDEKAARSTRELLESAGLTVKHHKPLLGGEDFGHYLREKPGAMWMLGAMQEGSGDHHMPTFNPDESVLKQGVLFWLLLATK